MQVTMARIATRTPMGQQAYEIAIEQALRAAAPEDFALRVLQVGSLRGEVLADRRIPWRLLERSSVSLAVQLGRYCYRGAGLLHRLDLRLPPAPGPEVVTAHDLPGLRFGDEGTVPAFLAAGARRARALIVPSQFAKQEMIDLLGVLEDRVHVIPYGLSKEHAQAPAEPTDPRLSTIPSKFVLHAAGATQRKNLASLAEAWRLVAALIPDVHLLLCGPPDPRRSEAFAAASRVHLLGALAPPDVAWLMKRAAAVVVPSTYEGFGLPALEGMAAAAPVVASDAGALPEVCAGAALMVEPTADGLAHGLETVLTDEAIASSLRAAGPSRARTFSWQRAAQAHLAVYRQAV